MICRRSGDEFLLWVQMDSKTTAALGSFVLTLKTRIRTSLTCGAARYPQDAHIQMSNLLREYALMKQIDGAADLCHL
jgi:hypothetical protein